MPPVSSPIRATLTFGVNDDFHMFGTLKKSEIEGVLKSQAVGRLACSAGDEPYLIPISFAYDGKFIYCHSDEGKKIEIMRKNPRVVFQADEMKDMANWKSVLVSGVYEELTDRKERNDAMQILLNRYLPVISSVTTHLGEHWPFHPEDTGSINGVVFRIRISSVTGRFESNILSPAMAG